MPVFKYKAISKSGQLVANRVEDKSSYDLFKKLKRNNLAPISVVPKRSFAPRNNKKRNARNMNQRIEEIITTDNRIKKSNNNTLTARQNINLMLSGTQRITIRDVMIFTQNFYLLKKANFNNIHALTTIIESTENVTFRAILEDILAGVENGENMYITMEYYSNVFPFIYTNMIKVGELSGSLTNALEQAVKYLDDTTSLSRKIKAILIPNIAQFVLLIVMLFVGTLFAIPAIQGVFDSLGTTETLPPITLWFQGVVNNLVKYWYVPTFIIAGVIITIVMYIRTPKGRYNFDYFKYVVPVFGKLIFALDFMRFIKAVVLNLQNGMRIQDALEVSKSVAKNYVMLSLVETAINNTLIGQSWIEPFENSGLASSMITEMLKIGMQTDLVEMMEKLLDYMQIDIDNIMNRIMKVLPEIVYSIVGVVLIFFVLVVLVPCIEVYMGTFLFSAYGF